MGVQMNSETNIILNKINELSDKIDKKPEDRFLTMKEACHFTSLSSSSLHRAKSRGVLKFNRSSKQGRILFRKNDLINFLSNNGK